MARHFTIVKYYDPEIKYEEGCGDDLVGSSTFIQCDIRTNRFPTYDAAVEVLKIVHDFNPGVWYGIATIESDNFGFISGEIGQR